MSWIIEQSENATAVHVNGNTVTCTQAGYYGSPINILYDDAANENGQYYWQVEFQELEQTGGASVGVTTKQGFKDGWGLRAMKYLGNLSDGSGLLVSSFGDRISPNDKIGILLQLNKEDLKFYIFHNDRPLGLAFHIQTPYPKPLYPVVSFDANGKVKMNRLNQIPTSLDRSSTLFTGINGNWKITNYPQHPDCVGYKFEIINVTDNEYDLHARVINSLNCRLKYNAANNQCNTSAVMATMMAGPPEEMRKEHLISDMISGMQHIEIQGQQQLNIRTRNGQQIQLERFAVPPPSPVTQNIFA